MREKPECNACVSTTPPQKKQPASRVEQAPYGRSGCGKTLRTHEPCVPTKQRINALTISRALFPFGQQHVDRLMDRIVLREDHTNAI